MPTPPVVTSTTATVPPTPTYPPLPTVPTPLPSGTRVVPPDIRVMIPDAPAKMEAADKFGPPDQTGALLEGGLASVPQEHRWRLEDRFHRRVIDGELSRSWPLTDAFTVFLFATLSRIAYGGSGRFFDAALEQVYAVLGEPDLRKVVIRASSGLSYYRWVTPSGLKIYAIPGTSDLATWVGYGAPVNVGHSTLPPEWRVYGGVLAEALFVKAVINTEEADSSIKDNPAIYCGHSLGGAIAQLLGVWKNREWLAAHPTTPLGYPVRAQYSYGAPAWLGWENITYPPGTLDLHARVYHLGDPVPWLTQFYLAEVGGLIPPVHLLGGSIARFGGGTEHRQNKTVQLVFPGIADANRERQQALRCVADGGFVYLSQLMNRHAVSSYCEAAGHEAAKDDMAPQDLLKALTLANFYLTFSDTGLMAG